MQKEKKSDMSPSEKSSQLKSILVTAIQCVLEKTSLNVVCVNDVHFGGSIEPQSV